MILLIGQERAKPTLDDSTRAAWILALLGIIVLGMGMMVVLWLFGRMVRNWFGSEGPLPPSGKDHLGMDWSASNQTPPNGTSSLDRHD